VRKPVEFENHPIGFETARTIGCYRAVCKNVTDGDTYDVFIDLGMNQYAYLTVRLRGLDTAEIFHPSNLAERTHGLAAKARAEELILQKPVLIRSFKDTETFGRYVADVYYLWPNPMPTVGQGYAEVSLATTLREEGFAKKAVYA
jgi:endonuclease YncB( thermonuclease family)